MLPLSLSMSNSSSVLFFMTLSLEEYRSVILQNVRPFGLFSHHRLEVSVLMKDATERPGPSRCVVQRAHDVGVFRYDANFCHLINVVPATVPHCNVTVSVFATTIYFWVSLLRVQVFCFCLNFYITNFSIHQWIFSVAIIILVFYTRAHTRTHTHIPHIYPGILNCRK
jgi:hypothetical protein